MNPLPTESQKATTASEVEVPSPVIDLSIYVMPAFATLAVSNLERSRRWYVEGLGFALLAEIPGPSGDVALMHLRRWRYQDLLLVPARSPLSSTARRAGRGCPRDGRWERGRSRCNALEHPRCACSGPRWL